jgi:hypothetical protein
VIAIGGAIVSPTNFLGLHVPSAGPLFFAVLLVHVLAALTCVVAGLLAATARKRPGRHPRSGRVYLWGLGFLFVTATVLAVIRWQHDAHLFVIAAVTFGLGLYGWWSRRAHRSGWERHHASGMGGSYIALLTGFYVDNGPQLPGWRLLPHWSYWLIPAAVGLPLIGWALRRFRAGISARPRGGARSAASPHQPGSPV